MLQGTVASSLLPHGVQDIKAQLSATLLGLIS